MILVFLHANEDMHCGRLSYGTVYMVTNNFQDVEPDVVSRDNVVGIGTSYWLDDGGVGVPSPGRVKIFHFSMSSRPALGSTQSPIQWVQGLFPGGKNGRVVKLTTHLQLMPWSRNMCLYVHSPIRLHGVVLT
jgi:hypothetical protein